MSGDGLKIAFQGELGANSQIACNEVFPNAAVIPCLTFEDALGAVSKGTADFGMIPIENTIAGRVADIHNLLPDSGLYIVGEHFLRVRYNLFMLKTASADDLKTVHSHEQALSQCRNSIRNMNLEAVKATDTAGAAKFVAETGDKTKAAIAPPLAGEIYDLQIVKQDIEDEDHNTTRFVILSRERNDAPADTKDTITSFIFRVRNVPASLYKAMGGFATNGINMTKLESYQIAGGFIATQFYAEIDGHPSDHNVHLAFEELQFFTNRLRILGAYKSSPLRAGLDTTR